MAEVLPVAMAPRICRNGWLHNGQFVPGSREGLYHNIDFRYIMSTSSDYQALAPEEQERIYALLPRLIDQARAEGFIRDSLLDQVGRGGGTPGRRTPALTSPTTQCLLPCPPTPTTPAALTAVCCVSLTCRRTATCSRPTATSVCPGRSAWRCTSGARRTSTRRRRPLAVQASDNQRRRRFAPFCLFSFVFWFAFFTSTHHMITPWVNPIGHRELWDVNFVYAAGGVVSRWVGVLVFFLFCSRCCFFVHVR